MDRGELGARPSAHILINANLPLLAAAFEGLDFVTSHEDGSIRLWKSARDGSFAEWAAIESMAQL